MTVCRPCDRRWYCDACAPVADRERLEKARGKYRKSSEGKAQHAAEEQKRRAGLRRGVGDQCRIDTTESGSVRAVEVAPVPELRATNPITKEAADGLLPVIAAASALSDLAAMALPPAPVCPTFRAPVQVTLVYPWRLRAAARAMLGTVVSCGVCGRGGVVARLVPARTRRWCR